MDGEHEYIISSGGNITDVLYTYDLIPNDYSACIGTGTDPYMAVVSENIFVSSGNINYGKMYIDAFGSSSIIGSCFLFLGNSIPSGTSNNSAGFIRIFGTSSGYTDIAPANNSTSNISLTLPSVGGRIPVASLSGTTLTITL